MWCTVGVWGNFIFIGTAYALLGEVSEQGTVWILGKVFVLGSQWRQVGKVTHDGTKFELMGKLREHGALSQLEEVSYDWHLNSEGVRQNVEALWCSGTGKLA